jgi:HEAT repeat protein
MIVSLAIALPLFSFSTAPMVAVEAVPVPSLRSAQDDEEKEYPDKRPEVKEWLAELKDHVAARGKEDREAVALLLKLTEEFRVSGEKDRVAIVKAVAKCLDARRKELQEDVPDNTLKLAAAKALGAMGPESVRALAGWVDNKKVRGNLELQRRLVFSLGETKDKDATKALLDILDHHQPSLVGAAGEALGQFTELELKDRKKLFQELLKALMSAKGKMDADPADNIAREWWNVVSAPLMSAMTALSKHDAKTPEEWQRFWNKNKKKDWDKGK